MKSLTLIHRLLLIANLPKKGGSVSFAIKSDIIDKTKLTQEEITKYEISDTDVGVKFNKEGGKVKFDIKYTDAECVFIEKFLNSLDKEEKLTDATYSLFKVFC